MKKMLVGFGMFLLCAVMMLGMPSMVLAADCDVGPPIVAVVDCDFGLPIVADQINIDVLLEFGFITNGKIAIGPLALINENKGNFLTIIKNGSVLFATPLTLASHGHLGGMSSVLIG